MISFENALTTVLSHASSWGTERVTLLDSQNRILAEDIFSDMDMPPFDKSAVDGFACRMADILGPPLTVVETIPAGMVPGKTVGPGQCSRIMTGAMVPAGADCVIMVEDTVPEGEDSIRFTQEKTGKNICYRGEDVRKGTLVIPSGTQIKTSHIAVMASVGTVMPLVSKRARIAIISTGDELVEPDQAPGTAQIRNSNACQLIAQVSSVPAIPINLGIVRDDQEALRKILIHAFETADLVILTGGVSMGDFDYVPAIMKEIGVEILFKSIAIQPGKPTVFGRKGNQFVFGLPGNPVSSFVLFEMLVKPFLLASMGCKERPIQFRLPMGTDFKRRKSGRKSVIPVRIAENAVFPADYHGSAHIHAYTIADGWISMEADETEIRKGEWIDVRPI